MSAPKSQKQKQKSKREQRPSGCESIAIALNEQVAAASPDSNPPTTEWKQVPDESSNVSDGCILTKFDDFMNPAFFELDGLRCLVEAKSEDSVYIRVSNPFDAKEAWSYRGDLPHMKLALFYSYLNHSSKGMEAEFQFEFNLASGAHNRNTLRLHLTNSMDKEFVARSIVLERMEIVSEAVATAMTMSTILDHYRQLKQKQKKLKEMLDSFMEGLLPRGGKRKRNNKDEDEE